jgi:hypothetical protein
MYGYGTVADLMDPAESTRIFLRGVPGDPTRVRHWSRTDKPKNLTIAQACQWVQGSEFPTGENYAPMEAVADQLIAHFGGLPQTKDWFNTMTASNWDEAKAELDASLATLKNQVASLYNDNVLTNDDGTPSGLPYGKQAAGFNDLRALIQRSGLMAVFKDNGTGWLYAVAPGVFRAFPEDIRELGAKGGLFTTAVVGASGDELVKLRDAVLMAERSPGDGIYAPDADGKVNFR